MRQHRLLEITAGVILSLWTAAICGFLAWNWHVAVSHAEELARKEARIHFNKDLAFRRWATRHGGVYVRMDARTPPNPGLAHIPERDIATPSGKPLTLMNPAYIMRQTMSEYAEQFGVQGKITSLKLINPANAADAWETAGLQQFEAGAKEVSELTNIGGLPVLRLMGALKTEEGCLKCHAHQGYKVGDVRGGVSVLVSIQPYLDDASLRIRETLLPLGLIWLAGTAAIVGLFLQIRRRFHEQHGAQAELRLKNAAISRANADLTRFAEVSAHHLMEPTRRLTSYTQRLRSSLSAQPILAEDIEIRNSLTTLEHDAGYLRALVRDIQLYLAAAEPRGEVRLEDANAAWLVVEQRLAAEIGKLGAQLEVQPLPPAILDRPRLTDLFAILVENALRHGRPAQPTQVPHILIRGERVGDLSRYFISDNGTGVPVEYQARVFEIFERLNVTRDKMNANSVTGIGLAIARRIVESRHGRIWIENLPQGGAMVTFELPDGEAT